MTRPTVLAFFPSYPSLAQARTILACTQTKQFHGQAISWSSNFMVNQSSYNPSMHPNQAISWSSSATLHNPPRLSQMLICFFAVQAHNSNRSQKHSGSQTCSNFQCCKAADHGDLHTWFPIYVALFLAVRHVARMHSLLQALSLPVCDMQAGQNVSEEGKCGLAPWH